MESKQMIGPILYLKRVSFNTFLKRDVVTFVPDYSKPGVKERIIEECELTENYQEWRKGL
jgi:hypothetical protein